MGTDRGAVAGLAPVGAVVGLLFAGGLAMAVGQSVGLPGGGGWTWAHYAGLAGDEEWRAAAGVTLVWATAATVLSAVLGVAVALGLRRMAGGSGTLAALLQVPVAVPHLAMAGVLLQLLGQSGLVARAAYAAGWIGGPAEFPALFQDRYGVGIVLTYVVKETPFVALVALAMLRRAGTELEDVAATLGATAWQRFRHVTLPLIAPPVVAASLMVFAFVFGSFEVPLLLGRPYPAMVGVVAQRRFASTELADRPGAMAAGVLMALLAGLAVWGYLRLSRRLVGERPVLF